MMALQTLEAQIPLEAQPESQTAPRMTSERVTEAEGISFEEYLERYSAYYYELIAGEVIKMSPVGLKHNELTDYLRTFLRMFFGFRPVGRVLGAPFPMKLPHDTRCGREPNLQIILEAHYDRIHEAFVEGPADIVIEIVAPESVKRDHGEKFEEFEEYEKGGVPEYWIVDYLHKETRFYRLDPETGLCVRCTEDAAGMYRTSQLPQFELHVPALWELIMPSSILIYERVQKMVGQVSADMARR